MYLEELERIGLERIEKLMGLVIWCQGSSASDITLNSLNDVGCDIS
jgi:hypothetical protein